jgi:phosphoribosyl 1,2-cyclic phosphodiesterase
VIPPTIGRLPGVRFASLGSGSGGNGLLVECTDGDRTVRLLVDCGFAVREAQRRLAALDLAMEALDAILVTHEHGDHVGGAFGAVTRSGHRSAAACHPWRRMGCAVPAGGGLPAAAAGCRFPTHRPRYALRDRRRRHPPIAVPHDAREPVQFLLDDGRHRLAVLTDLGHPSPHVVAALTALDALVLESNHADAGMLQASDYPPSSSDAWRGPGGHLSNDEAARGYLRRHRPYPIGTVIAAHLSRHDRTSHGRRWPASGAQVRSRSASPTRTWACPWRSV